MNKVSNIIDISISIGWENNIKIIEIIKTIKITRK